MRTFNYKLQILIPSNQLQNQIKQVHNKKQHSFILQDFQNAQNLKYEIAKKVLEQGFIQYKGKTMRFQYFQLGPMPQDGYRLVFGLHGGGGCPFEFNQQQWNNHQHLYDNELPPGTIWFVTRSPEDVPDMWWKDYIPHMLTTIIQYFSALDMIDMNQVFLTGYSAGGDGLYHIAGIMADYLVGAAMMAGHPNEAYCQNLRNIVISIQVGEEDTAYDRANWAKVYMNRLNQLKRQYGGFVQYSQIHSGMGHWMEKKDKRMFKKFFDAVRDPYPDFILFRQHPRF